VFPHGPVFPTHSKSGHVTEQHVADRTNDHLHKLGIGSRMVNLRHRYEVMVQATDLDPRLIYGLTGGEPRLGSMSWWAGTLTLPGVPEQRGGVHALDVRTGVVACQTLHASRLSRAPKAWEDYLLPYLKCRRCLDVTRSAADSVRLWRA
jgi:hypothetical protein